MRTVDFFVMGTPTPQGSKRAFAIRKGGSYSGKVAMVEMSGEKLKSWRQDVREAAMKNACGGLLEGPLRLSITFFFKRPKCHFRGGKNSNLLKVTAPYFVTSKPDLGKLIRATEDAITGILWNDDSQVVRYSHCVKVYAGLGQPTGARINIEQI